MHTVNKSDWLYKFYRRRCNGRVERHHQDCSRPIPTIPPQRAFSYAMRVLHKIVVFILEVNWPLIRGIGSETTLKDLFWLEGAGLRSISAFGTFFGCYMFLKIINSEFCHDNQKWLTTAALLAPSVKVGVWGPPDDAESSPRSAASGSGDDIFSSTYKRRYESNYRIELKFRQTLEESAADLKAARFSGYIITGSNLIDLTSKFQAWDLRIEHRWARH